MLRPLLGGQTFVYNGRVYARHISLFNDPGGVQALKTGFTNEAVYNLSVSAWRNGQQFLMIVLGSRSRALSFLDAKRLLRFGFIETGLKEPVTVRPSDHRAARCAPGARPRPPPRRSCGDAVTAAADRGERRTKKGGPPIASRRRAMSERAAQRLPASFFRLT
jgi:D-alanyl-D-alanine carboxypeptidase